MPIKALVFDCGGVVLRDRDESYYARWEQQLDMHEGDLKRALYESPLWAEAESGRITEEAFWRAAGQELGLSLEQSDALGADAWASWGVDPIVISLVHRARARFRVAMLSNATDALESKLQHTYNVAHLFDPIVNSSQIGIAKPDPAIYLELLRRMRLEAGETVFIDDRADNVAAAAALGMHVIWFVHPNELERQLLPYLASEIVAVEQP
ncbi:MAG: HAD family phosphatase [Anaerolineae bacterium]